jgi:hypothetical protein
VLRFFNLKKVRFVAKLSVMGVTVELHNTGNPADQAEIVAAIEHTLAESSGDWRVSIVGSQGNDRWDMKIQGPNGFERSYTLEGSAGEHEPNVIRARLARLLPLKTGAICRS